MDGTDLEAAIYLAIAIALVGIVMFFVT